MDAIMSGIASQEWLEPLEVDAQELIHGVFAGGDAGKQAKNFLHGTWLGHPLHVVLTDVPIGAWSVTLVCDLLDGISSGKEFASAADASLSIGLVGALAAAATGFTDWQDVDPPARRVGLIHGLLNLGGTSLMLASLIMRKKKSRSWGHGLAALGYATAMAAAYLGGKLVYEQKIGVDHADAELPAKFTTVLAESELPEAELKRADFEETQILLVRRGKTIHALAETCSHLGGPLSEGKLKGNSVVCPWHGSRFSLTDGRVLDGPAVHPQPCLEVRVQEGKIQVRKSATEKSKSV
ncbi:MAG: Rieske 2Fe-2S domain-containing protein [Acidobacteriota bacterium]|nr:Rieske 2Fe-2S domain-containing protein [Acidobacteriota bacterium]